MNRIVSILLVGFLLFVTTFTIAAPPPPPAGAPGCWPPPCVPIDGGIIALMAIGALYAIKKLYDTKKQKALD